MGQRSRGNTQNQRATLRLTFAPPSVFQYSRGRVRPLSHRARKTFIVCPHANAKSFAACIGDA